MIDSRSVIDSYLKKTDWRVAENSNSPYSFGALNKYVIGEVSKQYWLDSVYTKKISNTHRSGKMHIHDLGGCSLYCSGYSLRDILIKGVKGVPNIPVSSPAKHFDSVLSQIVNLTTIFQNEIMGAVAFNSFDTLLAPFVKRDALTYKQIEQQLQNFIFAINSNSRAGAEPAFSNITLDIFPPDDLIDSPVIIGGEPQDFVYRDCQEQQDMINRAFCSLMLRGDSNGRPFSYPIPTYNIHKGFKWDNPNNDLLWEMAGKYGYPYFANYVNSDMDASDSRSMCPMTPDTEVFIKDEKSGGLVTKTISDIYNDYISSGVSYSFCDRGGLFKGIPNRFDMTPVYEITFGNNTKVKFGENHLQPIDGNETKKVRDLVVGMKVPFNFNSENSYTYVDIIDIQKIEYTGEYLYCIELDSEDKLFTLWNGLVTHNCRLRLDLTELKRRSGGLFGSGDSTGCYDESTELLTESGWKMFKDLTMDDTVYTLSKDRNIELHKPIQLFEYDHDGDMIKFKTGRIDLLVTPNHRMVFVDKHTGKMAFTRADEYSFTKHPIPRTSNWTGEDCEYFTLPGIESNWNHPNGGKHHLEWEPKQIPMDKWLYFLGLFLSEGSYDNDDIAQDHGYRVCITQLKPANRIIIANFLDTFGYNYTTDANGFIICNKQLWNYVKQFGHCYDKYIPQEFKKLSTEKLQYLFDALMLGDGHIRPKPSTFGKYQKSYYTSSKKLADDVQEIMIKIGFTANINTRERGTMTIMGRTHKTRTAYEVYMNQCINSYVRKGVSKEYYKGKVYCCEVPNNTVMVRRNGKISWCGNSVGVCTVNLPRIAYNTQNNKKRFFKELDKVLEIAKDSLEIKRVWLNEHIIKTKAIPAFCEYVGKLDNYFSTIGIVGMNEMCENFFQDGTDITAEKGHEFAIEVGNHIREVIQRFQIETGNFYNYEATPAESTCYRLAKKDVEEFDDIITRGTKEAPYYTNSCHMPVSKIESINETFKHQEPLQTQFTGGTVIHIYMNGSISGDKAKSIVKSCCENYKVPYVSLSPINRYCPEHGYVERFTDVCPKCGKKLDLYQRITGYLRKVEYFNDGKRSEFFERKQLNESDDQK